MSIGWSAAAETELRNNTFKSEWVVKVDVISSGGSYGTYQKDITDRLISIGTIKRSTSCLEKDWKIHPVTVVVSNDDGYFTANRFSGSGRDTITNIWQFRDSGEADPEECKLLIYQKLIFADGSTEEKTRFEGMIKACNLIVDKSIVSAELIAQDFFLDSLDKVLTYDDGDSGYIDIS